MGDGKCVHAIDTKGVARSGAFRDVTGVSSKGGGGEGRVLWKGDSWGWREAGAGLHAPETLIGAEFHGEFYRTSG